MTKVTFRNSKVNHELIIDGHHEDKLACAGISSIAWALAGALANECDIDTLIMDDGFVKVKVLSTKHSRTISAYFQMAYIGLRQIELEYPNTISFK